jgi:hypothetical protein
MAQKGKQRSHKRSTVQSQRYNIAPISNRGAEFSKGDYVSIALSKDRFARQNAMEEEIKVHFVWDIHI